MNPNVSPQPSTPPMQPQQPVTAATVAAAVPAPAPVPAAPAAPAPASAVAMPPAQPAITPVAPTPAPAAMPLQIQNPAAGPATAAVPGANDTANKIKASGNAVFGFGILLAAILTLLGGLAVSGAIQTADPNAAGKLALGGLQDALSIALVVFGYQLKHLTADRAKALAKLNVSMGLCAGIFAVSIVSPIIGASDVITVPLILSLIMLIYLAVRRSQIKV